MRKKRSVRLDFQETLRENNIENKEERDVFTGDITVFLERFSEKRVEQGQFDERDRTFAAKSE